MSMRWLLYLYPPRWRARYGDEFAALLDHQPRSPRIALDVVYGALDAHLHTDMVTGRIAPMVNRLRGCEITIFLAYMLFLVGYLPFGRVADPSATWDPVVQTHPALGLLYQAVSSAAEISFAALLVGGVPVLLAALRRAVAERQRAVLVPFVAAATLLVVYMLYFGVMYIVESSRPGTGIRPLRAVDVILLLLFLAFSLAAAIAGPILIALVVQRSQVALRVLRFALLPAAVALLSMAVTLLGTMAVTIIIATQAPQLDGSQDTGVPLLIVMVALMAGAVGIATVAFAHAVRVRRPVPEAPAAYLA